MNDSEDFCHKEEHDSRPFFDGGDTGCGELLLDLLLFMKRQPGGAVVRVRALDAGAPLEIPAWCRLTKHQLLASEHPNYEIKKSESEGGSK
ncbi:MAG: sulfurtransferase TusA family protein [Planctomycetota bacterium]